MKICRLLGILFIPLMLAGCIKINITAGSGIEAGNGGPGRNNCALNSSNKCLCDGVCTCPSGYQCA